MGEHSTPNPNCLIRLLGIANVSKAFKSLLSKRYTEKKQPFFSNNTPNKPILQSITKIIRSKTKKRKPWREGDHKRRDKGRFKRGSNQDDNRPTRWGCGTGSSSRLLMNLSYHARRTQPPSGEAKGPFLASLSHKESFRAAAGLTHILSGSASRGVAAPIIFSNSSGLIRPAPMEKQLECTLEELCYGCVKKVAITRDAVNGNGQIVEEDETVTIKVEPGWRRGTKITFEGKGNQMPGTEAADVVFVIAEKEHPLFKTQEDDLQMGAEIMLVDALTGCTLPLPLLGGETTSLGIEDVMHPGYAKTIQGQGMPKQHEPGTRGDLIVNVSVKFPETLTQEQRSTAATILEQAC
ncbi:dnaJ subfamily B member 1-like [Salvia divinorum]|uniref:DnaJ subfamily B member 1-like n=1 Tax=Salvia divinorum TaxID=28513 RepID=A0ABD1GI66_SALDI